MKVRGLILAGFFAAALFAVITGCGGGAPAPAGGGKPADAGGGSDVLAAVKKAGVLKWGADASGGAPFVFGDPKNADKVIGFEMDLMDKLAEHMGVKHERVQAEWANLLENMKAKRTDIVINGIEINADRQKAYNFSQPYYIYEQQITVRAEDKDKIKSLDDLKGKKVGILDGTEAGNVLKRAGFTDEQIVIHPDSKTPYDNLKLKRIDAVIAESIIAAYYAGPDKDVFNVPQTFAPGKYGIAVRKEAESDSLLAELDKALKTMKENGELAAIYKKWNIWTDKQKEVGVTEK